MSTDADCFCPRVYNTTLYLRVFSVPCRSAFVHGEDDGSDRVTCQMFPETNTWEFRGDRIYISDVLNLNKYQSCCQFRRLRTQKEHGFCVCVGTCHLVFPQSVRASVVGGGSSKYAAAVPINAFRQMVTSSDTPIRRVERVFVQFLSLPIFVSVTMKFELSFTTWAMLAGSTAAFVPPQAATSASTTALNMVLEKPVEKKLPKIEALKVESDHLIHPLKEVGFVRDYYDVDSLGDQSLHTTPA